MTAMILWLIVVTIVAVLIKVYRLSIKFKTQSMILKDTHEIRRMCDDLQTMTDQVEYEIDQINRLTDRNKQSVRRISRPESLPSFEDQQKTLSPELRVVNSVSDFFYETKHENK